VDRGPHPCSLVGPSTAVPPGSVRFFATQPRCARHLPLRLNPRFVKQQGPSSCPPSLLGGHEELATSRGVPSPQRAILGDTCVSAGERLHPKFMRPRLPLCPAGHLPHCVVESVRERRSHLHPDRDHRHHLESRPHHEIPPVNATTNRGSRLRGRRETTPCTDLSAALLWRWLGTCGCVPNLMHSQAPVGACPH